MMGYGKVAAFAELGHFLYFNYVIDMITIKSMYYLGIHPYLLHRMSETKRDSLVPDSRYVRPSYFPLTCSFCITPYYS